MMPPTTSAVAARLRTLRLPQAGWSERAIQDACAAHLTAAGWQTHTEHRSTTDPRHRFDIWIPTLTATIPEQGIVVEIKKRRPQRASVERQIREYAETPGVGGVILVLERAMAFDRTNRRQVQIEIVSLHANWGLVC